MARQLRSSCNDGLLTNPPPIVGMEVSARWKRIWKGEVIMTIVMSNDVVDTEVYVKTSRGHTGIQMDPWMSCTWRRTWSSTHPPNTQTKEKIDRLGVLPVLCMFVVHQWRLPVVDSCEWGLTLG